MMDLYFTQVPAWVSISFAFFMISVPTLWIANTVKLSLDKDEQYDGNFYRNSILIFYIAFLLLIGLISLTGFFTVNTLPPRVVVFVVLPLFLFYLLFVQNKSWFKSAFKHVKLEQLIQIHLFRFVGIYFFILYAYEALPRSFAMIGGWGDVLTAIFAVPTIYFLKKKTKFAKILAWAWNIFGLVDILSVLSTAIITTRLAISHNEAGVGQFGTVPFSWIPAFAPATIVFLHILIFRKLIKAT